MTEQLPNNGETGAYLLIIHPLFLREPRKKLNPTTVVKPISLLYTKASNRH
jgi:hypothetical protein